MNNEELSPMEPEDSSVVVKGSLSEANLVQLASQAEKRVNALKQIKTAVLSLTNNHDWILESGRPYLQSSGAEKVARAFGIGWKAQEPTVDFREDGHYTYTFKGAFTFNDDSIEVIGTRSSYDPFFRKKKGQDPQPDEVDKANVKKAAYTNMIGNGITRMLGIRNMTVAELAHANINIGTSVAHDGKNDQTDSKKAEDDKVVIVKMLQELIDSAFEHPDLPESPTIDDMLLVLTRSDRWKGWESVERMSAKGAHITKKNLEEIHGKWMAHIDGGAQEPVDANTSDQHEPF